MRTRLDHAVIHVSDWARSNAFYRDVLGAEVLGDDPDGPSRYRFGDNQLNIHGPGVYPHPVARLPVQPGNSDLCFVWDGPIEGAIPHRQGAKGDGTSVYFRDPDGSLLEFISYG
jgi:catechol 2,3-dioxygenase-like lactoylglutathione lyase family enzyme